MAKGVTAIAAKVPALLSFHLSWKNQKVQIYAKNSVSYLKFMYVVVKD